MKREDQVQILTARAGRKRAAALGSGNLEAAIELGDVVVAQKAVAAFDRGDAMQPQLLRQAPLPGPEVAFRTLTRLRRE
jgi:hypothetical protein